MTFYRKNLGRRGEGEAVKVVKRAGMKLIERNFSCKSGEIDLVARHGDTLVFIEVKTRTSHEFGTAAEAVGRRKQEHITRAALEYIQQKLGENAEPLMRFDVITVEIIDNECEVEHIKDAF